MATKTGLTHECGVYGAIGNYDWPENTNELAQLVYCALETLQHRGQESCGMTVGNGSDDFHVLRGLGLVRNVIGDAQLNSLIGWQGIGHTRYATSAAPTSLNCQPFVVHSMHGALAIAHNGQLVNKAVLRKLVLKRGVGLSTHSDSELIAQALCLIPPDGEKNGPDWPARIRHLMLLAPLSYSLVIMLRDRLYAVRDPYGNRPLCLGRIVDGANKDVGWTIASESCAFISCVRYVREMAPGEILELTRDGVRTVDTVARPADKSLAFCIFEYVYFARPNSVFEGQEVYAVRIECGRQLAREAPTDADIVGAVPESGNAAAHGYSRQSGIPFGELLAKNTYVGRTFIQPTDRLRQMGVSLKFGPVGANVRNKRIVLIDDSIVRGNTIGPIIALLRRAGAKEVHLRVASPPLKFPCYMGINIPTREELIANRHDLNVLATKVGADSLQYLSVDGLVKAVSKNIANKEYGHCTACLTGVYPGGVPNEIDW